MSTFHVPSRSLLIRVTESNRDKTGNYSTIESLLVAFNDIKMSHDTSTLLIYGWLLTARLSATNWTWELSDHPKRNRCQLLRTVITWDIPKAVRNENRIISYKRVNCRIEIKIIFPPAQQGQVKSWFPYITYFYVVRLNGAERRWNTQRTSLKHFKSIWCHCNSRLEHKYKKIPILYLKNRSSQTAYRSYNLHHLFIQVSFQKVRQSKQLH